MYVPTYKTIESHSQYFYENNTQEYMVIHDLSIHKNRICTLENGKKHPAFESQSEALMFVRDSKLFNSRPISYHEVIKFDGTLITFVPHNKGAWHSGRASVKFNGETYLNRCSIGIALLRNAENASTDQYTQRQYETLAHRIFLHSPSYPEVNTVVLHKELSPERKTDPNFFDYDRLFDELHKMKP